MGLMAEVVAAGLVEGQVQKKLPDWFRGLKPELSGLPPAGSLPPVAERVRFDCARTGLQTVINRAADGTAIELRGICRENVRVEGKRLTLMATSDPDAIGPHGISGTEPGAPSLSVSHSPFFALRGLAVSGGAGPGIHIFGSRSELTDCAASGNAETGLSIVESQVAVDRCEFNDNAQYGVQASNASELMARAATISGNRFRGFFVLWASVGFCDECDLIDNGSWQAESDNQSVVSLRDSVVIGARGLLTSVSSYIDHDCWAIVTEHPCSLQASRFAGVAVAKSHLAFFSSGDFSGLLVADASLVDLFGARQQDSPVFFNAFDDGSTLTADWWEDENGVPQPNRLAGHTIIAGFSKAILRGDLHVGGTIACLQGGDLFADGDQVYEPGGVVIGCATYTPPGP